MTWLGAVMPLLREGHGLRKNEKLLDSMLCRLRGAASQELRA